MSRWDADLRRVGQLNVSVKPADAQDVLTEVITRCSDDELATIRTQIDHAIATFLPKRQRRMRELLQQRIDGVGRGRQSREQQVQDHYRPVPGRPAARTPASVPHPLPTVRGNLTVAAEAGQTLTYNRKRLSEALQDLAHHHIFQWATFYRDTLSEYFDEFLEQLSSSAEPESWLNLMTASLSHHATEIFQQGYSYQTQHHYATSHYAITKSLTGLQRFLDLPLEFYSARLAEAQNTAGSRNLRQLCSAMTIGILIGYANTRFDEEGSRVLPKFSGSWAHVLPFLSADNIRELMDSLQPGPLVDGIYDSVLPFARALDQLLVHDSLTAPLPALSQYSDKTRRLEMSLQVSPMLTAARRIEVLCYLEERHVDRHLIEEAAGRAVGLVIAPLRADLRIESLATRLRDIVVPTGMVGEEAQARKLVAHLNDLLHKTTATSGNRPIDFNWAGEFPLEAPVLGRYSHVYRTSVRGLLQSFERRNGIRLWCSVRRSGKTTACASDLGSTGQSTVVTQTCDQTGQIPDGDIFYGKVKEALDSGLRLPDDFVSRAVSSCFKAPADARVVLVLDEYETLFGELRTALDADVRLRYTVVQPLLNQLVLFSRDNLLIFVGQRPDAHWILTDQNQLSPVVSQDSFPLFTHGQASGAMSEFEDLVRKIMTGHAVPDPEFVDLIFAETGGHPFLTAKLLVSFWDWLIENHHPMSVLSPVRPELFVQFADTCLGYTSVAYNEHYTMFQRAAADHLSQDGRTQHPWLHAVYTVLRNLVLSAPDTHSVPLDQFAALAERTGDLVRPAVLLTTASRANFLVHDNGTVRPRIPLLGRIAAAVQPK